MLAEGKKAPAFKLRDQNGIVFGLKDFAGKNLVLYFYPKDNTSGCTKEACSFNDNLAEFGKHNTVIIGVSADSIASHTKFSNKYDLKFTLLSDESKEMLQKYEVWKEKSMYGKKYMGIERTTFVIDKNGIIKKIFPKVKVENHINEVLAVIKA